MASDLENRRWTFFTNHAHVLFNIAQAPESRMREIALRVGITEHAVQRVIDDLARDGYIEVIREGRRNRYRIAEHRPVRHPAEQPCEINEILDLILDRQSKHTQPAPIDSTPGPRSLPPKHEAPLG